jgi:hypothetical protein
MRKYRSPARQRARALSRRHGYSPGETAGVSAQPGAKKPKSKGKFNKAAKRGGVASGKRARMRADKQRRAGGGGIQAEPLPPPSGNIPGTDIPDRSRSEEAPVGTDLTETDPNMNEHVAVPNKDIDPGGWPREDTRNYPGIVNTPIPGSHRPRTIAPYRR